MKIVLYFIFNHIDTIDYNEKKKWIGIEFLHKQRKNMSLCG